MYTNNLEAKLFFVVDSKEANREIFETYRGAIEYFGTLDYEKEKPKILISLVNNFYYDDELKAWNYEDFSNTFNDVCFI